MFEIKVLAELVSSEGWESEPVPGLSPIFCWFAGNLWCSLACRWILPISAFMFTQRSPCVRVCVYVQIVSFYKDTSHARVSTYPTPYDLILMWWLHLQQPYFQTKSHLRYWLGLQKMKSGENTIQPITPCHKVILSIHCKMLHINIQMCLVKCKYSTHVNYCYLFIYLFI